MRRRYRKVLLFSLVLSVFCGGNLAYGTEEPNQAALEKLHYPVSLRWPYRHREISLAFDGCHPNLPGEMMVYKVKEPNVTEGFVRQLGEKRFRISSDANLAISGSGRFYRLKGEKWFLQFDRRNGSFSVEEALSIEEWTQKRNQLREAKELNYPSEEECKIIAERFLTDHNLLPEDAYIRGVADNIAGPM
jgi:hypothetical protein